MRINGWYATLGVVGISCFAAGCTTTVTSGNPDGAIGDDGAIIGDDGAVTVDDGGAEAATEAGVGDTGATCGIGVATGTAACDTCIEASCCTALTTCDTPDDAGVDDAGSSSCEQLVACIDDVNASDPDGGADAGDICNASYAADVQAKAAGFFGCIATSCATPCSGM
jgi:hypothetical protein